MSHIMFGTSVSVHNGHEHQVDSSAHRFTNPNCTGELWTVECVSARDQLWRVSSANDGSYLVAGVTPSCPWCGGALAVAAIPNDLPPANLEGESQWN